MYVIVLGFCFYRSPCASELHTAINTSITPENTHCCLLTIFHIYTVLTSIIAIMYSFVGTRGKESLYTYICKQYLSTRRKLRIRWFFSAL